MAWFIAHVMEDGVGKKLHCLAELVTISTPTLTGLDERSHLATRDTGLNTDILDIIQVLEYEDLNEIILVGHSYGVNYRWRSTENS